MLIQRFHLYTVKFSISMRFLCRILEQIMEDIHPCEVRGALIIINIVHHLIAANQNLGPHPLLQCLTYAMFVLKQTLKIVHSLSMSFNVCVLGYTHQNVDTGHPQKCTSLYVNHICILLPNILSV